MAIDHLRARAWELVETGQGDDPASRAVDVVILSLIVLSVGALILETVQPLAARYGPWFAAFEWFTIGVFTLEYLARVWACTAQAAYRRPVAGRIRYALTPLAIVDFLAIAPFYAYLLLQTFGVDLRMMRLLRLFRLLRVLKATRYLMAWQLFADVLRARREEMLITTGMMLFLLILTSCLVYFVEHPAQPERFSDIPTAMWWAVATLTTVGYGDLYPVTGLGRILGAIAAILGVGLFALPAGILGSGFVEAIQKRKSDSARPRCPHCGGDLTDNDR